MIYYQRNQSFFVEENNYTYNLILDSLVLPFSKSYFKSIIIQSGVDFFDIDNELSKYDLSNKIVISRSDTNQVRDYVRNENGTYVFIGEWVDYEYLFPVNGLLNVSLNTEKNELIGTLFLNRGVNQHGASIDGDVSLDSRFFRESNVSDVCLVGGYFGQSVTRSINFNEYKYTSFKKMVVSHYDLYIVKRNVCKTVC